MRTALVVLLAAAVVTVVACSSTLETADYETSCVIDADCVTVLVGDICDCSCDTGAISKKDEGRYNADRADISCSNQCKPCANQDIPVCTGGKCQAQRCAGSVGSCAPSLDAGPG